MCLCHEASFPSPTLPDYKTTSALFVLAIIRREWLLQFGSIWNWLRGIFSTRMPACVWVCVHVCTYTPTYVSHSARKDREATLILSHSCHKLTFSISSNYISLITPKKSCLPTWPRSMTCILWQYLDPQEAVWAPGDPLRRFWLLSRAPSTFLSSSLVGSVLSFLFQNQGYE